MVQGLAFLSKKSWHTKNLNNQERVWLAEEREKAEKAKTAELAKQIQQEREEEELNKIAGHKKHKLDRGIDWMYTGHHKESETAKEDAAKQAEEYLLGKEFHPTGKVMGDLDVDKTKEGVNAIVPTNEGEESENEEEGDEVAQRNEAFRLRHEDPMYAVSLQAVRKEKEIEHKKELYEKAGIAVVDRKEYGDKIEKKVKKKKSKKKHKKKKKKRHYDSGNSSDDSEDSYYREENRKRKRSKRHSPDRYYDDNKRSSSSSRQKNRQRRRSRSRSYDSYYSEDSRYERKYYHDDNNYDDDRKPRAKRRTSYSPSPKNDYRRDNRKPRARRQSSPSPDYLRMREYNRQRHCSSRSPAHYRDHYHQRSHSPSPPPSNRRGSGRTDNYGRKQAPTHSNSQSRSPENRSYNELEDQRKTGGYGLQGDKVARRSVDLGPDRELLARKREEKEAERRQRMGSSTTSNQKYKSAAEREAAIRAMEQDAVKRSFHRERSDNDKKRFQDYGEDRKESASFLHQMKQETHGLKGDQSLSERLRQSRNTTQRQHESFL